MCSGSDRGGPHPQWLPQRRPDELFFSAPIHDSDGECCPVSSERPHENARGVGTSVKARGPRTADADHRFLVRLLRAACRRRVRTVGRHPIDLHVRDKHDVRWFRHVRLDAQPWGAALQAGGCRPVPSEHLPRGVTVAPSWAMRLGPCRPSMSEAYEAAPAILCTTILLSSLRPKDVSERRNRRPRVVTRGLRLASCC